MPKNIQSAEVAEIIELVDYITCAAFYYDQKHPVLDKGDYQAIKKLIQKPFFIVPKHILKIKNVETEANFTRINYKQLTHHKEFEDFCKQTQQRSEKNKIKNYNNDLIKRLAHKNKIAEYWKLCHETALEENLNLEKLEEICKKVVFHYNSSLINHKHYKGSLKNKIMFFLHKITNKQIS